MKLWLDDIREPAQFGHVGWYWAKTADEAIAALRTGEVTEASLDHDLTIAATLGWPSDGERTGAADQRKEPEYEPSGRNAQGLLLG